MEYENEIISFYKTESASYCPCKEGMLNTVYCASKERCCGEYSIPSGLPVFDVKKYEENNKIITKETTIDSLVLN